MSKSKAKALATENDMLRRKRISILLRAKLVSGTTSDAVSSAFKPVIET